MPGTPPTQELYEVVCPHCNKQFQGQVMAGTAARYSGFKCPHCRLFVPFERTEETNAVDGID